MSFYIYNLWTLSVCHKCGCFLFCVTDYHKLSMQKHHLWVNWASVLIINREKGQHSYSVSWHLRRPLSKSWCVLFGFVLFVSNYPVLLFVVWFLLLLDNWGPCFLVTFQVRLLSPVEATHIPWLTVLSVSSQQCSGPFCVPRLWFCFRSFWRACVIRFLEWP